MRTITGTFYTYAILHNDGKVTFDITESGGMASAGWLLIDTREVNIEVEDVDYAEVLKQKQIDAVLAKQEKLSAELLELTS